MKRDVVFSKPKVYLTHASTGTEDSQYGLQEITYGAARISHDRQQRRPYEIYESELKILDETERTGKMKNLFLKCAKRGETSVFYQGQFGLEFTVPRLVTLALCFDNFTKYLQTSLRYTKAGGMSPTGELMSGEFYFPEKIKETELEGAVKDLFEKLDTDYVEMVENKIPPEDARFILPLDVFAKHIHANANFVSLTALKSAYETNESVPQVVKDILNDTFAQLRQKYPALFDPEVIEAFVKKDKHFPIAHAFYSNNSVFDNLLKQYNYPGRIMEINYPLTKEMVEEILQGNLSERANLLLSHIGKELEAVLVPMSVATLHQMIRQDTTMQVPESLYSAAERREIVVPPRIADSKYEKTYLKSCNAALNLYEKLVSDGIPKEEAIGIIPHGTEIYELLKPDGWNILFGFMRDRSGKAAQWEIRGIAKELAKLFGEKNPAFKIN